MQEFQNLGHYIFWGCCNFLRKVIPHCIKKFYNFLIKILRKNLKKQFFQTLWSLPKEPIITQVLNNCQTIFLKSLSKFNFINSILLHCLHKMNSQQSREALRKARKVL